MMIHGARLSERMTARGLSQSELARRIGISQQTVHKLITGASRGSTHIARIARELGTTPAYLEGEIDNPDEGAPPPPPEPQVIHVMLPVALPAGPALAAMFEGLLLSLGDWQKMTEAEVGRELATLLPTGLGVLRGPLRFAHSVEADDQPSPSGDRGDGDREPRRARRG